MGTAVSLLYFALFLLTGILLARRTLSQPCIAAQSALGAVYAVALLAALPVLFALVCGFGRLAIGLAGTVCALIGLMALRADRCNGVLAAPAQGGAVFWACVLPLFLFSVYLLCTHTLLPDGNGGYLCGQSTFGDLPMHLSFISYIAESGEFPPSYPLLAGKVLMGYPFLCESISSVFLVLGTSLRFACLLPQVAALFGVFSMSFLLFSSLLGSRIKAAVAYILFFLGSGFGVCYFLSDRASFLSMFSDFYRTPTNLSEQNIRWVNPIADLLVPQRATLFGWCIVFACFYLLWQFAFCAATRFWLPLGLLASLLPLMHTHSFFALFIFSAVLLIRAVFFDRKSKKNLKFWFYYAILASLLCLPQLLALTLPQATADGFVRFYWNWINHGTDGYFWFYIKNIGVVYLLLIPAFLHADHRQRWFYGGGLCLLFLCEIIVFQPNPYDNNKLLYIWHLIGCALVANLVVDLFHRLRHTGVRLSLCVIFFVLCCSGSLLTLGRETVSRYQQFTAEQTRAALFTKAQSADDALFLTADNHNNAICALAGRRIFCGSGSFLFYHGVDYAAEHTALAGLYEHPTLAALREWGIDYVLIGHYEQVYYTVDEAFYRDNATLWYKDGTTMIYQIPAL